MGGRKRLTKGLGRFSEDPMPKYAQSLCQVTVGARVTWVLSAAETLLCSMASGSIFFLIARLLTVMVSAFTDYKEHKGNTSKLKPGQNSSSQTTGVWEEKAFSHPHGWSSFWRRM